MALVIFAILSSTLCILSFRFWTSVSAQDSNDVLLDPMVYYSTMELLCSEGYPTQEHKVVTEDGYILTVHRLPNAKRRPKVRRSQNHYLKIHKNYHPDFEECVKESLNETSTGIPVIMVHGILMASDGWLLQGPGYDLAYLIADAGYDVWFVNVRGNFYSRVHKTINASNPKFWDFSFHENAFYDLPAVIDYVLKTTKKKKVFYVGFSMGTSIFFTMASTRPEYNEKLLGFIGLAPVAYVSMSNVGKKKFFYDSLFKLIKEVEKRKIYEVFPRRNESINWGKRFCSKTSQFQNLCYDLVSTFMGYHSKLVLKSKLHLYLTHIPTGTSIKTLSHFANNIINNQFRYYDYGPEENMAKYGRALPPDYPVWNITVPVALYYSDGDFFYDVKDEEYLRRIVPNVVDVKLLKKFNHADFLWSFKAKDLVYARAVSFLNTLRDQYYFHSRYHHFYNNYNNI